MEKPYRVWVGKEKWRYDDGNSFGGVGTDLKMLSEVYREG